MKIFKQFTSIIPLFLVCLLAGLIAPVVHRAQADGGTYSYYIPVIFNPANSAWIGPDGGSAVVVVVDPTNPNIYYAGSWGAGVFKSTNGGTSWQFASQGLGNLLINSMVIDPTNPNIVYAGTYWGGIYKTTDSGLSWSAVNSGITENVVVYSLAINPGNHLLVYAGTRGAAGANGPPWDGVMYRSSNGGASWTAMVKNLGGAALGDWFYSIVADPQSPNLVFAAAHESGMYLSSDYGKTWQASGSGISDPSGRAVAAIKGADWGTVYYGAWHRSGVFKSVDFGNSWTFASSGLNSPKIYPNGIVIAPSQPNTVYLADFSGTGVWKSTDAASTWNYAGMTLNEIYSLAVNPASVKTVIAGTYQNGIFKTIDGGSSWARSQTGFDNTQATGMVFPGDGFAYAAVMGGGVFQSQDAGFSWTSFSTGLGSSNVTSLVLDPGDNHILFALTDVGLFQYDLSKSTRWTRIAGNLPASGGAISPTSPQGIYPVGHPFNRNEPGDELLAETNDTQQAAANTSLLTMTFAPSDPTVAYLGSGGAGVYTSADGGITWNQAGLAGDTVWSIAVDPADPNKLYAATDQVGKIETSTDGGQHWSELSLPNLTIYVLAMSPVEVGALYAGTNNGFWKYNGSSWTQTGLAGMTVTQLAVPPSIPNHIYAGTTSGAYLSIFYGLTWNLVSDDLNGTTIQVINFDPNDSNHVYFGTKVRGTLRVWMKQALRQ